MSGVRYVVAWRDKESGKDYLPVDAEFYEINENAAKEAARDLLVPLRPTKLTPFGVMPMQPEDQKKMTKAPEVKFGTPPVSFIELGLRNAG